MILTLSGTAGSGKSTVAKILAKKLNLRHYSTGDLMREMAKERNVSLAELGKIAEKERWVDQELDKRQIRLGKKEDNFIIDGRLSFHFIPRSIKIFLDADLNTRAQRILKDIKEKKLRKEEQVKNLKEMIAKIKRRKKSETIRYQKYYKINPYQKKHYDLIVDTTTITAEQVAEKIVEFIKKKKLFNR